MMRIGRNKDNGLMAIAAVILMALFALSMLVSCKTVKSTTELYVHDTLRVNTSDTVYIVRHKTDSVIDIRTIYVCDTVIKEKGIVLVLNEAGDTIKERSWDNTKQSTHGESNTNIKQSSNDSLAIYKAKVDSILKALDQRQHETKVVEKGASLRDKLVFLLIVALVIVGVFKWIKN